MPDTRIAFADANWLVSTYHDDGNRSVVRQWRDEGPPSNLVISEAVVAECRCNFWRVGSRLVALESDLRAGLFLNCGYTFAEMTLMAEGLFRRYAPRCNVGTLDLLHIAAARRFGCRFFLSFDRRSGCRAVAHLEKLRVFPELNQTDQAWLAKLK